MRLIGKKPLRLEELEAIADGRVQLALDPDPEVRERIAASRKVLEEALAKGKTIYGVNTGFGASVDHAISRDLLLSLPTNLVRYHGCGTGPFFDQKEALLMMALRANVLALGASGVREMVIERLCLFVGHGVAPCIPQEGSVGASGDLTPLSYVAALLIGEREAWFEGQILGAREIHTRLGIEPLVLLPKEALAIMNGTSAMAALTALAGLRAKRLARLAAALTAMTCEALEGSSEHFDDRIFELKPHPGQRRFAAWVREHLSTRPTPGKRLQDRYSLRCAPHIAGVLVDSLPWMREMLEIEINSVNDNPIIDGPSAAYPEGRILHGGNFYGGHLCLVADMLKNTVANLGDLLDRQLTSLCNPLTNNGLPPNLSGAPESERFAHHGFKGMEITASALAAEALKIAIPASIFSRSTESHNQDKVSLGTTAAREALRVIELVETIAMIHLLALCQAMDLRGPGTFSTKSQLLWKRVRAEIPPLISDRRMDVDIQKALSLYRGGALELEEDWSAS
ncbi:MAG: aromatic amino acid ammonia-lyase [Sandaracinaceae bacterium]|nr:aromatic amino acid ammonia-lyase [Sandaracinaceae bacterium]